MFNKIKKVTRDEAFLNVAHFIGISLTLLFIVGLFIFIISMMNV